MKITVTQAFGKRSALRELADCYSKNQLSRQDYESHREQLIDHLSGIPVQLNPIVQMLLKNRATSLDPVDVTEPQDPAFPRAEITSAPARGHEEEVDLSSVTHVMGRVITARSTPAATVVKQSADKQKSVIPMQWLGIAILVVLVIAGAAAVLFFSRG